MDQRSCALFISFIAIAFVIGFLIGSVALRPDTESYKKTIAELEVQKSDLEKTIQAKIQKINADNLILQKKYDMLMSDFEKKLETEKMTLQNEYDKLLAAYKESETVRFDLQKK